MVFPLGAVIAAAGSVASGVIGAIGQRNQQKKAISAADPANIRRKYEAAGFNPLLGVNSQSTTPQFFPYQNYFGNSLAQAANIYADGKQQQMENQLAKQELEMKQQQLDKLIGRYSMAPPVGGVYQRGLTRVPQAPIPVVPDQSQNRPVLQNTAVKILEGLPVSPAHIEKVNETTLYAPPVLNPNGVLEDQETQRLAVPEGGNIGEENIYARKDPVFGVYYHEAPMGGQRNEDAMGDGVFSAWSNHVQNMSDLRHNLRGEKYDPVLGWVTNPEAKERHKFRKAFNYPLQENRGQMAYDGLMAAQKYGQKQAQRIRGFASSW